eukprot:scaffold22599_cov139-Cylindrotheca_fusiformis.AAC.29
MMKGTIQKRTLSLRCRRFVAMGNKTDRTRKLTIRLMTWKLEKVNHHPSILILQVSKRFNREL